MTASVPELEKRTSSAPGIMSWISSATTHLALGAEREHGADVLALARRRIHLRMAVAEDDRAIAQPVVDIDIVVEVPDARAAAALDVNGLVVAPVAEVGADAERQTPVRLLEMGV